MVCGVRHWVRDMKQQQRYGTAGLPLSWPRCGSASNGSLTCPFREQEAKINEQTAVIAVLEESLGELKRASLGTSPETSYASAPGRVLAQAGKILADRFLSSERPECDMCDSCKDAPADTELSPTSRTNKS